MRLAAIVLAAGSATRFEGDKLAAPLGGEPLLHHAIRAARAAPVARVVIVIRDGVPAGDWPGAPGVETVRIDSDALSTSLKAGIDAVRHLDGAFVFLGDMPRVPHDVAAQLAAVLGDHFAAVPRHAGRAGHPVLLSARAFPAIAALQGDSGAGKLLADRPDVAYVECDDAGILLDIDRPEDLAAIAG